ncbi:MAG: TolC family protein [Elusimicrobia bacterium]|nr:TolC family protein [Elusimicrobiota bacterium]
MKFAFAVVVFLPCLGGAQEPRFSWSEVAQAVSSANPEIRASEGMTEAAEAAVAGTWAPDSPSIEVERMYAPTGRSPLDGDEKSWLVRQEFDLPPASIMRRKAARRGAASAQARTAAVRRAVLARARAAFAGLRLVWVERDLLDQNIEILRRVARVAEAKVAAGRAGQADALKAQVELSKMQGMREFKDHELPVAEAELAALMGREPASLPRPEEPAPDAVPALKDLQLAAAERPRLRGAILEAQRAEAESSLARAELLPRFMLQYRRRRAPMTGSTHDAVAGVSLPLWFWGPASKVREADARRSASRAEADAARLETAAGVRTTHGHWAAAVRLAEVYRTALLPQAEAALRTAEAAYQSDRGGFLDLLDAQRSFLDLTLEYERTRAEAQVHRGELEDMVGKEL